jgi:hypothetical protein
VTTFTWIDTAGGDWSVAADWSSAPTSTSDLAITLPGTYTVTASAPETAQSLVLDAPDAVLVLDASLTVAGGFTLQAGTVVFAGGTLSVGTFEQDGGLISGSTVDIISAGTIAVDGGAIDATVVTLSAGAASLGALVVGNTGDLIINAGAVAATQSVEFENDSTTGTLTIGTLAGFDGVIDSFNTRAEIILAGASIASDAFVGNTLTLFGGGAAELGTLKFGPSAVSGGYLTTSDGAIVEVACFAAGTQIATARGEVAVEAIRVGDLVRTVLGGSAAVLGDVAPGEAALGGTVRLPPGEALAPVIWVGRRELDCARHPQPRNVWPVRVAAGAFGPRRPHSDLWLSPDHAVYVEEVLIPVRLLINGTTIAQVPVERVTYCHLELAEHDVLLAEGLPAESYLDMRDGSNYANRPGPLRLYPDYAARMWEAFGCARLIVTGPGLAAARALVASFAAQRESG